MLVLATLTCAVGCAAPRETPPGPLAEPLRVLLLGDSISIGYTGEVARLLEGRALVVGPRNAKGGAENCAGTNNGIEHVERWLALEGGQWDVIHFNFGLHDLKRVDPETGRNSNDPRDPRQAPPARYADQLEAIAKRLEASGARLVFATTTPVPTGRLRPHRTPSDALRYNAIARNALADFEVEFDDLFAFVTSQPPGFARENDVHFGKPQSARLARQVALSVLQAAGHQDPTLEP